MPQGTMPGTVLLLAASPRGKGCLVDAASVLPVLAAVTPSVLAGTDTANVVELADPLDPQAVLTRLRAAAVTPGPLTLFVAGQLQLDRRQRLPHLALARTTPATVRYTAFPWHWLREELRLRPAGATTLLLDLRADQETWDWLSGNALDCGSAVTVYGRVAPPPGRRTVAVPSYMKAVATILRSGGRPELERLHHAALARVAGEGERGDLLFPATPHPHQAAPPPPLPAAAIPPNIPPMPATTAPPLPAAASSVGVAPVPGAWPLAKAPNVAEAALLPAAAGPAGGAPPLPAAASSVGVAPVPGAWPPATAPNAAEAPLLPAAEAAAAAGVAPSPGALPLPAAPAEAAPLPAAAGPAAGASLLPAAASSAGVAPVPGALPLPAASGEAAPWPGAVGPVEVASLLAAARPVGVLALPAVPGPGEARPLLVAPGAGADLVGVPAPRGLPGGPDAEERGGAARGRVEAAGSPGAAGPAVVPEDADPHAALADAVRDARHADADGLAARWEREAARSCGAGSEEALHWAEVRADLAMFAGDAERSCRAWMAVAVARLEAGQPADAPAVEAAVDRAHHQWGRIPDVPRARELGQAVAELRARVPGRREGALDHVQQQLRQLGRLQPHG
ncbi:hypothetical protein [Streptomyces asoensis]|uniref:hypothetical protein n=1 Tax=Streptomyces asoensis TaxID=249586 RepID=UPI003F53FDFA